MNRASAVRPAAGKHPMTSHKTSVSSGMPVLLFAVLPLVAPALLSGPVLAAEPVELGRRYIDPAEGFSLRPPAGLQRQRMSSASLLVSWSKRDPSTGAVAWTLSVQRAVESEPVDLDAYRDMLAAKLRSEGSFQLASIETTRVADRGALDVRGRRTAAGELWQRQVWILAAGKRFLILTMTGQVPDSERLNVTLDAVLGTLELTDPQEDLTRRQADAARGKALLADLDMDAVEEVIADEPQWYLFELDGKTVGFMKVSEEAAERDGEEGVRVARWIVLDIPRAGRQGIKRVAFAAADGSTARWREDVWLDDQHRRTERGQLENGQITCTVAEGGPQRTLRKPIPAGYYLPKATGELLPRLVELHEGQGYAFAQYVAQVNAFDWRSFAVEDRETITLGGHEVRSVRARDQAGRAEPPATLWLDERGDLLRMRTEQGLVMEQATRRAVERRFPDADRAVARMGPPAL